MFLRFRSLGLCEPCGQNSPISFSSSFFCDLKIKYSLSTFDDVKNERRAHAFSGLHNMATVQVSEAEKVYILHGVRVSFIGCAHLNTSQCKCIVIQ